MDARLTDTGRTSLRLVQYICDLRHLGSSRSRTSTVAQVCGLLEKPIDRFSEQCFCVSGRLFDGNELFPVVAGCIRFRDDSLPPDPDHLTNLQIGVLEVTPRWAGNRGEIRNR